jgi:hypothetical protein
MDQRQRIEQSEDVKILSYINVAILAVSTSVSSRLLLLALSVLQEPVSKQCLQNVGTTIGGGGVIAKDQPVMGWT